MRNNRRCRGDLPPIAATLNKVLKRDAPGGTARALSFSQTRVLRTLMLHPLTHCRMKRRIATALAALGGAGMCPCAGICPATAVCPLAGIRRDAQLRPGKMRMA